MVGYAWYQLHIIYEIIIVAAQRNISTYTIAHSSGLNTKSRKSKKLKRKKKKKERKIHKIYRHTHTEAQSQPSGLVLDRWNWGQDILVLAWVWRHTSTRPLPESVLSYWFKQHGTPFLEELSFVMLDGYNGHLNQLCGWRCPGSYPHGINNHSIDHHIICPPGSQS